MCKNCQKWLSHFINVSICVALHELDFFSLFFIRKFHIELCHSRPTTYFAAPKKTVIFIYDIHKLYTYFQIKHWNMLYNVHTCIAIFFHVSYNPVSTHSINQNSYYKLCFTKIKKKKKKRIFTLFLISQNVAVLLWLVVGLIDIQHMQSVKRVFFFSKFEELILRVACSTKTLLSTRIKAFHIFPHTVASNVHVVFHQKYVLSEKDCLCPVMKIVHKYLMPQNFGNILFHLPTIQKH